MNDFLTLIINQQRTNAGSEDTACMIFNEDTKKARAQDDSHADPCGLKRRANVQLGIVQLSVHAFLLLWKARQRMDLQSKNL
ncbi:predicted protein [Botrytis cinerea T4]|uniref:Uncharacterized protein n=1 Tax=Botryotinia fuckeliana (strain T4) TaxID=999810 RepID=G2YCP3_BOTF4|nr:predicted protein [Botrytis cinerea T4]